MNNAEEYGLMRRPRDAERLPPHSPENERAVLGCCLQDVACLMVARQRLRSGDGSEFYDLRHQEVFRTLCEMDLERVPIDLITVQQRLRERGQLEAVGGLTYLNEMIDAVPSTANVEVYLESVIEKATLRALMQTCVRYAGEAAADAGEPVSQLVARFQGEVLDLTQRHVQAEDRPIAEPMLELAAIIEARAAGKQQITGVKTPFWYLNNMTCGLQKGEYYVIAARPSTGKTALAVDLTLGAALCGVPVLFMSIEMTAREIALRMLSNLARVNGLKLRNGFWRSEKAAAISAASTRIVELPIRIDDRKSVTGQDILMSARRAMRQHGVGMVVVDYIQKLAAVNRRNSRQEELSEASAFLARTAKELDVPVVVCAQLNRDSDKDRGGKKPLLADIKDCGSIEQDADVVGLLWEPKIDEDEPSEMKWLQHHHPDDPKDDSPYVLEGPEAGWRYEFRRINLTVGKNRNGPTGDCELVMQKASARFVDAYNPDKAAKERTLEL